MPNTVISLIYSSQTEEIKNLEKKQDNKEKIEKTGKKNKEGSGRNWQKYKVTGKSRKKRAKTQRNGEKMKETGINRSKRE